MPRNIVIMTWGSNVSDVCTLSIMADWTLNE